MLIYLTGIDNKKIIESAIYEIQMEHTISIGEPILSNSIDLLQEVKSNLCKNKDIDTLILDLSVITNEDDEIVKALRTLRYYNDDCKFIIIATERSIGDVLLSDLVDLGIYNIITEDDELITKIKDYTINKATLKDASIYKIIDEEEETGKKKKTKTTKLEKIKHRAEKENKKIILQPLKGKVTVSVIGTQNRVGVTYNSISLAYNLTKRGYKVAVVEFNNKEESDINYLLDCYENQQMTNEVAKYYKIYQIDFYSNSNQEQLNKINGLSYDYIILDNGCIDDCNMYEHNRADVKLVMFGSSAWEQHNLFKVFNLGDETSNSYVYMTLCDKSVREEIIKEMSPKKVIFSEFNPEPFNENSYILSTLDGYIYDNEEKKKKKSILSLFK